METEDNYNHSKGQHSQKFADGPTAEDKFKAGWKDLVEGNTLPIDTLWDDIDTD